MLDPATAGATLCEFEAIDGFGYQFDLRDTILDINYVMLTAEKNSITVLCDWGQGWGCGILRHRNDTWESALIMSIKYDSDGARDYILSYYCSNGAKQAKELMTTAIWSFDCPRQRLSEWRT